MNIPRLRDTEMLALAQAVQDLLQEIEESAVRCLKEHGLEQHATDLGKAADALGEALSPFIESGDEELWEALGIDISEDTP